MKKLAGLILIPVILILGGYYGMGVITEKTIKNNIGIINQPNKLSAHIEQYDRGWFSSDAKIKWHLHLPERTVTDGTGNPQTVAAQDYETLMPVKIYHGPFILEGNRLRFGMGYAKSVLSLPEQYNKQFDENFSKDSTKPKLDLNIFVNYFIKSTVELALSPFQLISKNNTEFFNWKGMLSNTKMSADLGNISGDIELKGLIMGEGDTKMTLEKATSDFNLHKTSSGLYLGMARLSLPAFDIALKDKKMLEVNRLNLSSDSDIKDNLFSTSFNADVSKVVLDNQIYGPGDIQISLRNLDAEILAEINKQVNAMQNGTEVEQQKAMIALFPELPKLFIKGAEFEISKLKLTIPEGLIEGNMLISLPKGDRTNPFELLQKLQGNAKLKMPKLFLRQVVQHSLAQQLSKQPEMQRVLIEQLQKEQNNASQTAPATLTPDQLAAMQTEKQISNMEQNGLIVGQGSDYVIEITLNEGKFTVNGKPFDSSMLK